MNRSGLVRRMGDEHEEAGVNQGGAADGQRGGMAGDIPRGPAAPLANDAGNLGVMNRMLDMMQQQQLQHAEQMNRLTEMQHRPQPRMEVIERFRKLNPKEFNGGTDSMIAEEWIRSLEVIFEHLRLTEIERVQCATFMLTTDAWNWWDGAKLSVNVTTLTGREFKGMFDEKYFPQDEKAKKVKEFLEIKQGGMTVVELVRKFEQGCRFVPFFAEDAEQKKNHLLRALNPRIRSMVRMSAAATFEDMVNKALMAEDDQRDIVKDLQQQRQIARVGTNTRPTRQWNSTEQWTNQGGAKKPRVATVMAKPPGVVKAAVGGPCTMSKMQQATPWGVLRGFGCLLPMQGKRTLRAGVPKTSCRTEENSSSGICYDAAPSGPGRRDGNMW